MRAAWSSGDSGNDSGNAAFIRSSPQFCFLPPITASIFLTMVIDLRYCFPIGVCFSRYFFLTSFSSFHLFIEVILVTYSYTDLLVLIGPDLG
jgi:NADH:ubiquinone oxidoreductase subunit 3 (subunit A)